MELTRGRLQATLVAVKILGTDEASAMQSGGLTTIGHGYQIEKAISAAAIRRSRTTQKTGSAEPMPYSKAGTRSFGERLARCCPATRPWRWRERIKSRR